jgi:hypothetical protein
MTDHRARAPHLPATTSTPDVLQVRVRAGASTGTGPSSSGDALAHAWSCVQTFAPADAVLLGAAGPADPGRLVAEGLAAAAEQDTTAGTGGDDLVVLVARGRPAAFAEATRSPRLRVVLVDDVAVQPADLSAWTGCLDGYAVAVTEPGQLAGAVCEALVHEGPALVHVGPGADLGR